MALPLCMCISIASGVPPEKGLITGMIGGLIVGLLAGSPLQVSGPAAGLAVIVFEIVQKQGLSALGPKIGRAHVCTPVTNAHLVCRLLLEKKKNRQSDTIMNHNSYITLLQHHIQYT